MNVPFSVISSVSILLPVVSGFYSTTYPQRLKYRALVFFFLYALITELVANILASQQTNNLWIYNIYSLAECIFWIVIIDGWLNHKYKIFLTILGIVYSLIWIYLFVIANSIFAYNNIAMITACIILIPLSCFFLLSLSRNTNAELMDIPEFWFAAALLFYFSSTAVITASASYIFNGVEMMRISWKLHAIFNIITNFIFAKAFLCSLRKTT